MLIWNDTVWTSLHDMHAKKKLTNCSTISLSLSLLWSKIIAHSMGCQLSGWTFVVSTCMGALSFYDCWCFLLFVLVWWLPLLACSVPLCIWKVNNLWMTLLSHLHQPECSKMSVTQFCFREHKIVTVWLNKFRFAMHPFGSGFKVILLAPAQDMSLLTMFRIVVQHVVKLDVPTVWQMIPIACISLC